MKKATVCTHFQKIHQNRICLDIIQEASYAKNNMNDNFTVLKYKLSCCSEGSVTDI